MLRILGVFVIAGALLAAAYGAAASLSFSPGVLQASDPPVGTCHTSGDVGSTYAVTFDTSSGKFMVDKVTLTGINSACEGKKANAALSGSSCSPTNSAGSAVTISGGMASNIDIAPNLTAQCVTSATAVIFD